MKNFADAEGRRNQSAKKEGRWKQLISRLQKLESYQELYDSNQKTIYVGQKIEDIANRYFNNKSKDLIADFENH
jgi:DNA mismatch repair protein MutS2